MSYIPDILALSGCGAIVYGVSRLNTPAAFIVGGLCAVAGAWMLAREVASKTRYFDDRETDS